MLNLCYNAFCACELFVQCNVSLWRTVCRHQSHGGRKRHILPTFNIYSNLHSWTINNTASLFLLPSKWLQLALSWLFPELVTKKFLRSRDLISAFSDKHKSEWIKDAALHSLVRLPPLRNVISLEISSLIHYLLTNTVMYYSPQIRWKITGSDFPAQFIGLLYILQIAKQTLLNISVTRHWQAGKHALEATVS